jgi:succinate dehydrogenase hydrophobic anchor subunit
MIIGVGLYVHYQHSELSNERVLRFAGLLLVLFVIGHLLLIEIWDMDIVPRIITFFVIGGLLMSTAFMKKLKKY